MSAPSAIIGPLPAAGAPSAVVRAPRIVVTAGGMAVTNVKQARHALGLDLSVGEATFVVPTLGDLQGATFWSPVTMQLSAPAPGGSPSGPTWAGVITDLDYDLYPRTITVTCHGYLVYADRQKNPQQGGTPLSGSNPGLSAGASPPLTLLGSSDGTDGDIVTALLAFCLPSGAPTPVIDDTGQLVGTLAPQSFVWAEKETALAYIQRLDEATPGWRTYDEIGGVIKRLPIDATPAVSATATFTEGVDILRGHNKATTLTMANRVTVTGYDQGLGAGPVGYTVQEDNGLIPNPPRYQSDELSSPMIEYALDGDRPVGTGLSCQSAANYILYQLNRLQERIEFITKRDDTIQIGDTIAVTTLRGGPDRLGAYNVYYVQHVDREITPKGAFYQTLVVLSGEASALYGVGLYGVSLYG